MYSYTSELTYTAIKVFEHEVSNNAAGSGPLLDTLAIPAMAAITSMGLAFVQIGVAYVVKFWSSTAEVHADEEESSESSSGIWVNVEYWIRDCGGPVIFWHRLTCGFGGVILLALTFLSSQNYRVNMPLDQASSEERYHLFQQTRKIYLSFYVVYLYTTILSFLAIFGSKGWSLTAKWHANIVYLITFLVFAYRDLYPLMTFNIPPLDAEVGPLLWAQILVLFVVGMFIPLIAPRKYMPLNPNVFYNLNRWVCIRTDMIGGLFTAGLAVYLVYFQNQSSANIGFSLNIAVGFSAVILWLICAFNEFEVQGISIEHIHGYLNIEQEPKSSGNSVPPAYWPAGGSLVVENLSAKYSQDGPKVLDNISFEIKSGERVGIVGRTGSGKSTLTLSLLRSIPTEGSVFYDGVNISTINLDSLRSKVTIIPQIPELLSGSLRHNLDPFDQYDDATLNDALRAAGLGTLQSEMDDDRITLDTQISGGGGNLSVGQRQILALARAVVRGSKLLILDEATSAIDHITDNAIQSSLRHKIDRDTTVITVAHRLQTIMDADKIMVLDAGRIVEYDSPSILLQTENGYLRSLVEESGEKQCLYEMAKVECIS